MLIPSADYPYLRGDEHENSLSFQPVLEDADRRYRTRIEVLRVLCAGRKVIHFGCVDHSIATIRHKIGRKKWVHKEISEVAARCYGVDINQEGIDFIKDILGFDDVAVIDILKDQCPAIMEDSWDYVLLPEILEHTDNPVLFLEAIREKLAPCVKGIIITVPNCFYGKIGSWAKRGVELINTDHRYWFSPYTLLKVAIRAGIRPERMLTCRNGMINRFSLFKNFYYKRHPMLRNAIVLVGDFE